MRRPYFDTFKHDWLIKFDVSDTDFENNDSEFYLIRNPLGYPEVCGVIQHGAKSVAAGFLGYGEIKSRKI